MKIRSNVAWGSCVLLALSMSTRVAAQSPAGDAQQPPASPPAQPAPVASDPDRRLDPLQPDFTLAALPTTLRVPKYKSAFRVTHRFTRSLGRGEFSDLLNDFFGFDSAAQIGLEYRFGLLPGTQIGVHRTSDRTIEIFGQQNLWQQKADGPPLGIDVIATLEGLDNLTDRKLGAIGLLVSRKAGKYAAFYVEPIFVANTNPVEDADVDGDGNNTMMIGLGARLRVRPALYLVGEYTPRVSGYKPNVDQGSFGVEFRAGGHTFQINFSNGFGTTLGQLAAGGITNDSWFLGFNISRKFF